MEEVGGWSRGGRVKEVGGWIKLEGGGERDRVEEVDGWRKEG